MNAQIIHNCDLSSTCRSDGECWCWRGIIGIGQRYKWGQARLRTGHQGLLNLPISNARRGFLRHGWWCLHTVQSADKFNVAQFTAKTKHTRISMRKLLFADDNALVSHTSEEMHKIVDAFSDASKKFGLKFIITKTDVLYQTISTRTREEDIMVDGNKLKYVLEFTYLSADYARDSGTTTLSPCGLKARHTVNRAGLPPIRNRGLHSVLATGEKEVCLHDAPSAFMRII